MNYIYILKSKNQRYYIGSTNNIERRIAEHNFGKTKSLKYIRPLELVFAQKYDNLKEARKIELRIKKFKNKSILEKIIKDGEIKTGL